MKIAHTSLVMSTYLVEQKIIVVGSLIYHVSGKRLHGPTERLIQLKASRWKSIEHERRKAGIYSTSEVLRIYSVIQSHICTLNMFLLRVLKVTGLKLNVTPNLMHCRH